MQRGCHTLITHTPREKRSIYKGCIAPGEARNDRYGNADALYVSLSLQQSLQRLRRRPLSTATATATELGLLSSATLSVAVPPLRADPRSDCAIADLISLSYSLFSSYFPSHSSLAWLVFKNKSTVYT